MKMLRQIAALGLGILWFAVLLLASPFVIVGAVLMALAEKIDEQNRRLLAEVAPPPLDPVLIPSRESLIRQIDTLSALGASPLTIRAARDAVDKLYPPKVH